MRHAQANLSNDSLFTFLLAVWRITPEALINATLLCIKEQQIISTMRIYTISLHDRLCYTNYPKKYRNLAIIRNIFIRTAAHWFLELRNTFRTNVSRINIEQNSNLSMHTTCYLAIELQMYAYILYVHLLPLLARDEICWLHVNCISAPVML